MENCKQRIRLCLTKSVEGFIEAGRVLLEFKDKLDRKQFLVMLKADDFPVSESTTHRLMDIAKNPVLTDFAHAQKLPPHWGTLCELTKLPEKTLEAKIEDGTITADTERKDVMKMLTTTKARTTRTKATTTTKNETDEFTNKDPVRLNPIERVYQVLDAWDEELVFELRASTKRTEFIRRMTNLVERGREMQEHSADVEDKPITSDRAIPMRESSVADYPHSFRDNAPEDDADLDPEMRRRRQRAEELAAWRRGLT